MEALKEYDTENILFDGAYLDFRRGGGATYEILNIEVPSEKRRMGYGRKLLERLFAIILERNGGPRQVFAITRSTNFVAQQWYEKMRFDCCILRRFYNDAAGGIDAVLFVRSSGGPV